MARLFKNKLERKKGLWRRVVDLALTDVRVVAGGMDLGSLEALEERLLAADFGVPATMRLIGSAEQVLRRGKVRGGAQLVEALKGEIRAILEDTDEVFLRAADSGPTVFLMVGVNGVGKTTSVAKLAHFLVGEGRKVMVAAADFVRGAQGGDPAAVAFDALDAAEARGTDVVLIDTAGRLHTNSGLMMELEKIDRVVRRRIEGAPHETLLVLDATVGQNAVRQLAAFKQVVDVSGIVLAKIDSSARGGIVVALREEYGVPIKLVGTGEGLEDLESFEPQAFVEGVFER